MATVKVPIPDKRVIVWRLTERCNAGCLFCSYSVDLGGNRINTNSDEVRRFGKILGQYKRNKNQDILVSWIGGEPFLWPAIIDVSRYFKQVCELSLSITTNGLPLSSQKMRRTVLDYYDELIVSIDGLPGFHNWCRGTPLLFEKLKKNLELLRLDQVSSGRPIKLKANTVLMRGNVDCFEDLCEILVSLGIKELTFNQLGGISRPAFFTNNSLLLEQVEKFAAELPRIRQTLQTDGFTIRGSENYLRRISASASGVKIPIEECHPGKHFLSISERGIISPCDGTAHEYGVRSETINSPDDIDALTQRFRAMRQTRRSKSCADCHSTQVFGKFEKIEQQTEWLT